MTSIYDKFYNRFLTKLFSNNWNSTYKIEGLVLRSYPA